MNCSLQPLYLQYKPFQLLPHQWPVNPRNTPFDIAPPPPNLTKFNLLWQPACFEALSFILDISPSVHKPSEKYLQRCKSPGLICNSLWYAQVNVCTCGYCICYRSNLLLSYYIVLGPVPEMSICLNPGLKFCSVFVFYICIHCLG